MADNFNRSHLTVRGYSKAEKYKYPKPPGGSAFPVSKRNRAAHGKRILKELEKIRNQFNIDKGKDLPQNIVRDDAIYVQFTSDWGYELKFDQLNDNGDNPKYQILNIIEEQHPDEKEQFRYNVVLMLTEGGISHFIKRVNEYLKENTKRNGVPTNTPKANGLIANIENIQRATLKAFWTEFPETPFPSEDLTVWWEVWFRKPNENEDKVIKNLTAVGATIGSTRLVFAEHVVRLVKATAHQLSGSLILLDNLSELRKPQEMNDFITHQDISEKDKKAWLDDLLKRTEKSKINDTSVLVCLLDSGANNKHPVISAALPDDRLYTWKEDWGKYDSVSDGGHGTGMAGLVMHGDLTEATSHNHNIRIYHGLESFKIFNPISPNDPDLYGAITEYACSVPFITHPKNPRVFCLSVTNKDFVFKGRPSSSSASIDKIAFGSILSPNEPQLVLISGGNVIINKHADYPNTNFLEDIQDPGQAYNAITVGSFTRKDKLESDTLTPLAPHGGMAPSNSTSATWETQWPNKPDIVMEGGNMATDGTNVLHEAVLKPLSIDSEYPKYIFLPFDGTSAAVALASKMAAELRTTYPQYWPETIRGLMIHSADWTDSMLQGRNIYSLNENERRALLRSVGYGVPVIHKALYSANNSLTLVAQNTITPYSIEASTVKYNEYHFFELPWPMDILRDEIGDKDVTIKITLSYYIEPNPGSRQYAANFRYHSHELDFKLIKPLETVAEFKRRVSASSIGLDEEEDKPNLTSEEWTLREKIRSKGSIKKDFVKTSGAELSMRNKIAVYPKNGWYRTRKKLEKYNSIVRYALIVSIETEANNIDIYTSVENLMKVQIPIAVKSSKRNN